MIIETPARPAKRKRGAPEMKIQAECVKIAWNEFPETRFSLFHVANEVDRPDSSPMIGAMRRAEGIVRGVSDLILLLPRNGYHALCIEMKTESGYQSSFQKNWQSIVESNGYKYVVCRSAEQFRNELKNYLGL